jgi:hypothetical protein
MTHVRIQYINTHKTSLCFSLSLHVCVCMYVDLYVYMYIYHTYIHICIYMYVCIYIYRYKFVHTYMYIYTYVVVGMKTGVEGLRRQLVQERSSVHSQARPVEFRCWRLGVSSEPTVCARKRANRVCAEASQPCVRGSEPTVCA